MGFASRVSDLWPLIGDKFPKPRGAALCRLLLKESGCCATSQAASASAALDKWRGSFYGGHRWSNAKSKKSVARKVKRRTSARKVAPRKAKRGYDTTRASQRAAKSRRCTDYKY